MRFKDDPRWQEFWRRRMQRGQVTRILAVPPFMEAASLLMSAAELWIGRYGAGRLTAGRLRKTAGALRSASNNWLQCTLGWAGMGTEYDNAAFLLSGFRDHRSFCVPTIIDRDRKSPRAARLLVETAAQLVSSSISTIRQTGIESARDREADSFEDLLEELCDGPFVLPPPDLLTPENELAAHRSGVMKVVEGLASSVCMMYGFAPERHQAEMKPLAKEWSDTAALFRRCAAEHYAEYLKVPTLLDEDRELIMAVRDQSSAYCFSNEHYRSPEEVKKSSEVAMALIDVLLRDVRVDPADFFKTAPNASLFLSE